MINWNTLILGLVSFALGLVGLLVKSSIKTGAKRSLSDVQVMIGTYSLLFCGIFLTLLLVFFTNNHVGRCLIIQTQLAHVSTRANLLVGIQKGIFGY